MTPPNHLSVSVCLVTYEAGSWLRPCLESILAQSIPAEIIVVDNASSDGTREALCAMAASDHRLRVVTNARNVGFARGQNQAIALSTGDAVCLLNQDVELDSRFLEAALGALVGDSRIGSVQGRVRRLRQAGERLDILDTTGLVVRRDRRFLSRGEGHIDGPSFDLPGGVFGADGPCPVYRREALEDVREPRSGGGLEILDEDFFLYHEDTDLAWRLQLRGWRAAYEPRALAWHGRGVSGAPSLAAIDLARHRRRLSGAARIHGWRNHRLMQVKNDQGALFRRDCLPILRREIGSFGLLLMTHPGDVRAVAALLRALPGAIRKRRWIQRHRTVSTRDIGRWFSED